MSSMSPARATLLHSPGWNEGKARYETLGKPRQKWVELLQERHFRRKYLSLGVPPLQGSFTSFQSYFDALALVLCNGFHEVKKKYLSLHRASLKVIRSRQI